MCNRVESVCCGVVFNITRAFLGVPLVRVLYVCGVCVVVFCMLLDFLSDQVRSYVPSFFFVVPSLFPSFNIYLYVFFFCEHRRRQDLPVSSALLKLRSKLLAILRLLLLEGRVLFYAKSAATVSEAGKKMRGIFR